MGNTTFIQLIHRNRVVTPTCNPKATFWEFGQWLTQGHQQNSAHCGWGSDWGFGDLSIIFSMIDHFPACHWLSCFSRKTPRILPGHLVFSQGPAEDERSTERSWLISKQQELVILLMEGLPHQLIYGEYHRISHFSWASIDNRWFSRLISEASSDLFLMDYYRNPWGLSRSSGCPLIRLRFGCTWVRKLKMWQCSQKTWLLYPVETLGNTTHPTRKCRRKERKKSITLKISDIFSQYQRQLRWNNFLDMALCLQFVHDFPSNLFVQPLSPIHFNGWSCMDSGVGPYNSLMLLYVSTVFLVF